jgi:para-aminobenzoate synthetase component 1
VLADGKHALDLLKHCFPGGSITGAPKIRAMEIIEELEPNRRGVYCGSIGYIGFDGNMDSNIAIRTLVHSDGKIRFWAGGGIVNDSVAEEEYQECFDKAAALLDLLRQFSDKR